MWPGKAPNITPTFPGRIKASPGREPGNISTIGNLKEMSPQWLVGASMLGYGVSLYSMDYPKGDLKSLGEVSYKQLRSGHITINGKVIATAPLSSYLKAREISSILKEWIEKGEFVLGEPQFILPSV